MIPKYLVFLTVLNLKIKAKLDRRPRKRQKVTAKDFEFTMVADTTGRIPVASLKETIASHFLKSFAGLYGSAGTRKGARF